MGIEQAILDWDGKSADDIQAVFKTYAKRSGFINKIVDLSLEPVYERGSTWLIKAWLESGNKLDPSQISKVYASLNKLEDWQAKLHVLQSIPYMPISNADSKKVHRFLINSLSNENKFVRAWSYNGLHELSKIHTHYLEEANMFFKLAMRDEAPSVKARIRNILKNL